MSKLARRIAVSALAVASVCALAPAASAATYNRPPAPPEQFYQQHKPFTPVYSPYGERNVVCNVYMVHGALHACYQQRPDGKWQKLEQIKLPDGTEFDYYPVWEDPASLNAMLPVKIF